MSRFKTSLISPLEDDEELDEAGLASEPPERSELLLLPLLLLELA